MARAELPKKQSPYQQTKVTFFRKKKPFHSGTLVFQLALLILVVGRNNINGQNVEPNYSLTYVDSQLDGWRPLEAKDFKPLNSVPSTWSWRPDGLYCSGQPVSVLRTAYEYTYFKMTVDWSH